MRRKKDKINTKINILDSEDYLKTSPEKHKMTEKQLADLLSGETKIDLKIEKALEGLPQHYTALLTVEPQYYSKVIPSLFKRFVHEQKIPGVYISVNKSYERLAEELDKHKICMENIAIIDMITKMTGLKPVKGSRAEYLESATNLTELMIALERRMKTIEERQKFIILDSISTLLVYNEASRVEKLIHALIEKVNKFRAKEVLITVKSKESRGVVQTVAPFCDRVADIT